MKKIKQYNLIRFTNIYTVTFQKIADTFINKWRELFQSEHVAGTLKLEDSSDDEPITKYRKNTNNIELSEDVKYEIKDEIQRVIYSLKNKEEEAKMIETPVDLIDVRHSTNLSTIDPEYDKNIENGTIIPAQIVFADVNNMKCEDKSETMASLSVVNTSTESGMF